MPFKRPAAAHQASSGRSPQSPFASDHAEPPSKRARASRSDDAKVLPDTALYLVQAKLDGPAIAELLVLAERHCARVAGEPADADAIVTAITMRKRFERHVPWDVAELLQKSKAIVTPNWLRDSVREGKALPCEPYVALQDLREETIENCPACRKDPCECEDSVSEDGDGDVEGVYPSPPSSTRSAPSPRKASTSGSSLPSSKVKGKSRAKDSERKETQAGTPAPAHIPAAIPGHLLAPSPPVATDLSRLSYTARYACQRPSPLVCLNQALCVELDVIKRSRILEGEERSALSYARAISIVKAYPYRITSRSQVEKLPYLGTKILGLVEEFLDREKISEARLIASSDRFNTLSTFSSIYGIGPTTARRLYALGLRTIHDLAVYYGVEPEEPENELVELQQREKFGREAAEGLGETWVKIALGLRHDLEIKIPRDEVEEMGRAVMRELDEIEPGCTSTIVGGYRRGKQDSNDVDIVFTHPDPTKSKGLCKRLVRRLYERGMVTHVMHLSGFHGHNPLRTAHWDTLEKALTIFILPRENKFYKGTRRRLDLIFAQPEVYWCAVIGWSGSIMFQRDLRLWAKDKCQMKFDSSGITRRYDSEAFYPKTEKEVFELFGLEWVDTIWRNADV